MYPLCFGAKFTLETGETHGVKLDFQQTCCMIFSIGASQSTSILQSQQPIFENHNSSQAGQVHQSVILHIGNNFLSWSQLCCKGSFQATDPESWLIYVHIQRRKKACCRWHYLLRQINHQSQSCLALHLAAYLGARILYSTHVYWGKLGIKRLRGVVVSTKRSSNSGICGERFARSVELVVYRSVETYTIIRNIYECAWHTIYVQKDQNHPKNNQALLQHCPKLINPRDMLTVSHCCETVSRCGSCEWLAWDVHAVDRFT